MESQSHSVEDFSKASMSNDAPLPSGNEFNAEANPAEESKQSPVAPSDLIDTCEAVASLVDSLSNLPAQPPSLYIDLEGIDLSRIGSVSIFQLYVLPQDKTYVVDIHTLGSRAFVTPGTSGQTLKSILESNYISKAFFDVRCDSDALYSHYSINLAGVCDIQLMELATRSYSKRCVKGLAKCISEDLPMTLRERQDCMSTKNAGRRLFAPECGGSFAVFNIRPMSQELLRYCKQDVQLLPRLWQHYHSKLSPRWAPRVEGATVDRIRLSQSPNFVGKGRHMALGPWN